MATFRDRGGRFAVSAPSTVRVLVAEDEQPLRDAICDLIASEAGLEVAGTARSAAEAVDVAAATRPDVALVDVRMPGGGVDAARRLRERSPKTVVLALSAYEDRATVLQMLRAGAVGYLVKGISPVEIVDSIRRATRGQASLSVDVIAGVVDELDRELAERSRADDLQRQSDTRFRELLAAQAELERNLAERRSLLAHLVAAGEEERARIAEDIHDDSIQAITAAGMRLQILRRKLSDPEQLTLLDEFERTIQLSIARLRHLLFELRPPVLDNDGLSAAVETYLHETREGGETRYRLDDRITTQPEAQTRTILYRIVQEALVNARKHAEAGNVTITLSERDAGYQVRVADDGVGFAAEVVDASPGHLGLRAMRERALLAGGWMRIDAEPGRGTSVEVWVPATPDGSHDVAAEAGTSIAADR
jgi:signal transduction histidine kinase